MIVGASPLEDFAVPVSTRDRVARLSEGQRQCLVMVNQHLSSKEIALKLGISSHTVDQRVRLSLHILGVDKRGEAARMVASVVPQSHDAAYQQLIHQPPYIDARTATGHQDVAVGQQIRQTGRAGETSLDGLDTEPRPTKRWASLPLPFATRSQPANEMSVGMRLLWIILIATGAAFSAGMYLAGLESLTRMLST